MCHILNVKISGIAQIFKGCYIQNSLVCDALTVQNSDTGSQNGGFPEHPNGIICQLLSRLGLEVTLSHLSVIPSNFKCK